MKDLGSLFASIKPGDLLMIPCLCGKHNNDHTVLAVKSDTSGEVVVTLSHSEDSKRHLPWLEINPVHWCPLKTEIIDRDGDVVGLPGEGFQLERGGAMKQLRKFLKLPELKKPEISIPVKEVTKFLTRMNYSNVGAQIVNQIGDSADTDPVVVAAYVLENLGQKVSVESVAAVVATAYTIDRIRNDRKIANILVSLIQSLSGDDDLGKAKVH